MNIKRNIAIGIAAVALIIAYGVLVPSKHYFACSASPIFKHTLIVNKYLFGVYYTLDDYKVSQCTTTDRAIDCEDSSTKRSSIFNRLTGDLRMENQLSDGWPNIASFLTCDRADQLVR